MSESNDTDDWFGSVKSPTQPNPDRSLPAVGASSDWFEEPKAVEWWPKNDENSGSESGLGEIRNEHTGPGERPHKTPQVGMWWRRNRSNAIVSGLGALLVVVGATSVFLVSSREPAPSTGGSSPATVSTAGIGAGPAAAGVAAADLTWCAGQDRGEPISANSADPGIAAIWKFESAFYFGRDAAAARAAGAPDAVMASTARLQQGIDQLEPDVEFCVLADSTGPSAYNLTVVERGPGIDGRISRQRVTTANVNGQTMITAILPR